MKMFLLDKIGKKSTHIFSKVTKNLSYNVEITIVDLFITCNFPIYLHVFPTL